MRQKIAMFKVGNSVSRVQLFQERSFYIQKEMNNWIGKSIVFDDDDDS